MCALKPKNTMHTIEDAKMAEDLGAIGLQIDLPFFHHPKEDDLVRFYSDISDAIGIGIMIYNTHWFNKEGASMTADTMLRLKDAEHVIAIKWSPMEGQDYDEMRRFSKIFNVIDNSGQAVRCHKNGGRGYISGMIAVRPKRDLEAWQLLEQKRYDEAQARLDEGKSALAPWQAKVGKKSGGYRSMKGLMAAIGLPAGPPRPPTLPIDDEELAEAKRIVKELGWVVKA
jgi:4-hydroxy-tetrahydrodipicolinate synthase